jgi:hypothetical protein
MKNFLLPVLTMVIGLACQDDQTQHGTLDGVPGKLPGVRIIISG